MRSPVGIPATRRRPVRGGAVAGVVWSGSPSECRGAVQPRPLMTWSRYTLKREYEAIGKSGIAGGVLLFVTSIPCGRYGD